MKGMTLIQLLVTLAVIGLICVPVYFAGVYLFVKVVKWAWGA